MSDVVLSEDPHPGVRVLTLNRPDRLNALNADLVFALREAVRGATDSGIKVLILTAEGRAFCAGADLKWLASGVLADHGAHMQFQEDLANLCAELESAPQVVIAAVNGYALAGGFELVLSCDLVVAAADAQLGDEHIKRAILPGGGGSQRLPRKIGLARGLYHLLTGRRITGLEAVQYGLACAAPVKEELAATALSLATEMASYDALALDYMKQMVRRGIEMPLTESLVLELFMQSKYRARSSSMDSGVLAFAEGSDE